MVAAYESSASDRSRLGRASGRSDSSAQFVSWELAQPAAQQPNILSSHEALVVRFTVSVQKTIAHGAHGIALYNSHNTLVWAAEASRIVLEPGVHYLDHRLDSLPLRPGPYFWQVSLWDDHRQLDLWNAIPELLIDTKLNTHSRDEWQGLLNLRNTFHISERGCQPSSTALNGIDYALQGNLDSEQPRL